MLLRRYLWISCGILFGPQVGPAFIWNYLLRGRHSSMCCKVRSITGTLGHNTLTPSDSASTGLGIIYAGRVIAGLAIGAASNLAVSFIHKLTREN